MLKITNLHVKIESTEILKGVSLTLEKGKVHALMGPNGSGKSTLANVLMGNPKYEITQGKIELDGVDITHAAPDERAKAGLFLSFQYPSEITGVSIANFLRTAYNATHTAKLSILEFRKLLKEKQEILGVTDEFINRYLNEGFSGGEKKRSEILQLLTLDPQYAILDETDSGLDIDALKAVSEGINVFKSEEKCILIITHYKRILEYIKPDVITIIKEGVVVHEGDGSLVDKLEEEGYGWITQ
jgi:Fe-S cluster assembly ATP-binding protein